jgi:hypothetical protein
MAGRGVTYSAMAAVVAVAIGAGVIEYRYEHRQIQPHATTLTDALVSYWKMDEATSQPAMDACGMNTLQSVGNIPSTPSGVINAARVQVIFGSMNANYLRIDSNPTLLVTGSLTWSVWFRPDRLPTSDEFTLPIFSKDSLTGRDYTMDYDTNGQLRWYIGGGNPINSPPLPINVWHLGIAWFDYNANPHTVSLQVDNGPVITGPAAQIVVSGTELRVFGRPFQDYWNDFYGAIDEMGYWNRLLTPQERSALWNNGNGLAYENFPCGSVPLNGAKPGVLGGGIL